MDTEAFTRGQWLLYRLVRRLTFWVGSWSCDRVLRTGAWGGRCYFRLASRRRQRALAAAATCFPDRDPGAIRALVVGAYEETGRSALETIWTARSMDGGAYLDAIRGREETAARFREMEARGRGFLVMTAHLSNFELMLQWAGRLVTGVAVVKALRSPPVNRVIQEMREQSGIRMLPAKNSYRDCLKCLKGNGVVGFILDQNMIRTEGIFVDFFGRPACTSPGLAMLSAQAQAPVLPLFMVREPDGLRLVPGEVIEPPPDRSPEVVFDATQAYTKVIEDAVRAHPEQWIWMHNRWKTRLPPGAPDPGIHRFGKPARSPVS